MTRKMWALIDRELPNRECQLYGALDGRLFVTKPIPSHKWLEAVRVEITITEIGRATTATQAKRAVTPHRSEAK